MEFIPPVLPNLCVFLYDLTGHAAQPWLEAGRICLIVDLQHPQGLTTDDGRLWRLGTDLRGGFALPTGLPEYNTIEFACAFPPCDHLAVSGARWFKGKGLRSLSLSIDLFATAAEFCEASGAPYFIENPVSTISTYWRSPDSGFHPWQFTGIDASDNYMKNTCLWVGNGFAMPNEDTHPMVRAAVDAVMTECRRLLSKAKVLVKFAGRPELELLQQWYPDDRIHTASPGADRANIRSETPMGFSRAVMAANENLF